ncbi:MAG: hypothetical protein AAGF73_01715 [Actinomycetota bacterium]
MAESSETSSTYARTPFANGASIGVGSLPHTDSAAASAFSIGEFEIATVPTLPRRSAAAGMLAQAATFLDGVEPTDRGLVIEREPTLSNRLGSPSALDADAFADLDAFLDLGSKVNLDGAPVKWQFAGPITVGCALVEAGLSPADAFALAGEAVDAGVRSIEASIADVLPNCEQLMLFDEPWLVELMNDDFPVPPDHAVDVLAAAMAAPAPSTAVGVHCCGPCDVATVLATGPRVISVPVDDALLDAAGYLARFIESGGVVAWGVVPTDGPVADRAHRWWRRLSDLWCALVQRGCDPVELRQRSLVSTECGLAGHTVSVARTLARQTGEVSRHVRDQAAATRLTLGA